MIRKLEIKNFQSHKHSVLEMHEGVNIIVGTSDSGKTAILRALKWVVKNRPGGDEFISHWGGPAEVIIELDEAWVTRTKGKAENTYSIHYPIETLKEPTIFKAFGSDVPEEVSEILNLPDINFQNQLDPAFLLTESPGAVAAHFNKIAHLNQIDASLKYINQGLHAVDNTIKAEKKKAEDLVLELEEYNYLYKMEIDIEQVESQHEEIMQYNQKLQKLKSLILELEKVLKEATNLEEILSLEDDVLQIESTVKEKEQITGAYISMVRYVRDLSNIIRREKYLTAQISLKSLIEETLETAQNYRRLKDMCLDLKRDDIAYENISGEIQILETTFHENFPDVCPLCGVYQK